MKSLHNLSGQNLLRHKAVESYCINMDYELLISDSIRMHQLLLLVLLPKKKAIFHFLELYTFSLIAFFSEFRFRARLNIFRPILFFKLLIFFFILFFKLLLFKLAIKKNSAFILSSDLRKAFVKKIGFTNPIFVLRNKPCYSTDDIRAIDNYNDERAKRIVLIGNLNSRADFLELCRKLEATAIKIYCYGISKADKIWLKKKAFSNVFIFDAIASFDIPMILRASQYGICLYSQFSLNQKYSASSKIYELLFCGAIPIVNSNPGLLHELDKLNAKYLTIQDIKLADFFDSKIKNNLYRNRVCLFESEMYNLKRGGVILPQDKRHVSLPEQ